MSTILWWDPVHFDVSHCVDGMLATFCSTQSTDYPGETNWISVKLSVRALHHHEHAHVCTTALATHHTTLSTPHWLSAPSLPLTLSGRV
jgi:hypothetical protein